MKKQNYIKLIICIVFIIIVLISLFVIIKKVKKTNFFKRTENETNIIRAEVIDNSIAEDPDAINQTQYVSKKSIISFERIKEWNNYLDALLCIDSYNYAIENLYNEKQGTVSDVIAEDPSSKILSILDKNYASQKEITKENVDSLAIGKYKYVSIDSYFYMLDKSNCYFVTFGYLFNKETDETKDYGYFVRMNYINNAFELIPYEGLVDSGLSKIDVDKEYSVESGIIEKKTGNTFSPITVNDKLVLNFIINQFKYNSLHKPDIAFNQLNSEYASKYGSVEGFKQYINQNKDRLNALGISKNEKSNQQGEDIVYKCYDSSNNEFFIQYSTKDCSKTKIKFSNIIL